MEFLVSENLLVARLAFPEYCRTIAIPGGQVPIEAVVGGVEAPAAVFRDQHELHKAFSAGELNRDCVVVVPFQGPKACGMPELHRLTPPLSVLPLRDARGMAGRAIAELRGCLRAWRAYAATFQPARIV